MFKLICVIFASIIVTGDGARILGVFPTPSISHQVVFRPLMQELVKRGHELVILTTDPAYPRGQAPPNMTEIDFHDISYEYFREHFTKKLEGVNYDFYKIFELVFKVMSEVAEIQIQTQDFQNLINSNVNFDLIFVEAFVRPMLIVSHVFKAPVIQISSFGAMPPNLQTIGAPSHPILYPELSRRKLYNLTVWEKMQGAYDDFLFRYLQWSLEDSENKMIQKYFGPNAPTVSELSDNVDMMFLNIDPMWDANRPVPPSLIHLGGLHQKPRKEVPKDLKSFLDGSKHGVIYMSFGTNIDPAQLPPEKIEIFTKVFSKLPYDVLWKWNQDELPKKPDNVKISKWLPQADLLWHPKIKLFITQGGLQSSDESITAGVPLIAFPTLGDQWYNAEKYVHYGIGIKMDLDTVSEETLTDSINKIIHDDRYRRNIKQLGALMRDKPDTPLERAVWWTEYVIRHRGAKHLRAATANVSWAQYLMVDVLALALALALSLLVAVFTLTRYVYVEIFRQNIKLKST